MQKQLKNLFSYRLLLLFLPLIFVQCNLDSKNEKIDYHGKLKYFKNQYGIEHFIEDGEGYDVMIVLPECFTNDYSSFSISNKNNFVCYDNNVYFSVDVIPKSEINFYAEYFNDEKIKSQEDVLIMRDYCVDTRAFGLLEETRSIYSNILTKENKAILLGSVKGKSDPYAKELFYQFGVIEGRDSFYILQAIMSVENTSFLHQDILEIFKSFKIN